MGNKQKTKKRVARKKRLQKQANIRRNNSKAPAPYILKVDVPGEGWKPMMTFRTMEKVDAYVEVQEDIRKRNASPIAEGRVIDRRTGRMVAHIKPHKMEGDDVLDKTKKAMEDEEISLKTKEDLESGS